MRKRFKRLAVLFGTASLMMTMPAAAKTGKIGITKMNVRGYTEGHYPGKQAYLSSGTVEFKAPKTKTYKFTELQGFIPRF